MSSPRILLISVFVFFYLHSNADSEHHIGCYYHGSQISLRNYNGAQNVTTSGKPCLVWSSRNNPLASWLPNEHHNFCRSPFGSSGKKPWCYITLGKTNYWEQCDVPNCKAGGNADPERTLYRIGVCENNVMFLKCEFKNETMDVMFSQYGRIYNATNWGFCDVVAKYQGCINCSATCPKMVEVTAAMKKHCQDKNECGPFVVKAATMDLLGDPCHATTHVNVMTTSIYCVKPPQPTLPTKPMPITPEELTTEEITTPIPPTPAETEMPVVEEKISTKTSFEKFKDILPWLNVGAIFIIWCLALVYIVMQDQRRFKK